MGMSCMHEGPIMMYWPAIFKQILLGLFSKKHSMCLVIMAGSSLDVIAFISLIFSKYRVIPRSLSCFLIFGFLFP